MTKRSVIATGSRFRLSLLEEHGFSSIEGSWNEGPYYYYRPGSPIGIQVMDIKSVEDRIWILTQDWSETFALFSDLETVQPA